MLWLPQRGSKWGRKTNTQLQRAHTDRKKTHAHVSPSLGASHGFWWISKWVSETNSSLSLHNLFNNFLWQQREMFCVGSGYDGESHDSSELPGWKKKNMSSHTICFVPDFKISTSSGNWRKGEYTWPDLFNVSVLFMFFIHSTCCSFVYFHDVIMFVYAKCIKALCKHRFLESSVQI